MSQIAMPSVAIRRILAAIGLPPNQWDVVGVDVTLVAGGPSLVRVYRVGGRSEETEDYELLDGEGWRLMGWKLTVLADHALGQSNQHVQRATMRLRAGEVPTVAVESVALVTDVAGWAGAIEQRATAVPVIDLKPTVKQRCTVCYNPNCDEPGGKH
jgi:hypothetical protein